MFLLGELHGGLQELAHNPVGEVALQIAPTPAQDVHPTFPAEAANPTQERRLADSGGTLDEKNSSRSRTGIIQHRADALKLMFAIEQFMLA